MNSIYKSIYVFILTSSLFLSCTKNFDEKNTDPNRIDQISPGTLLNPIIYNMAGYNMQQADNVTFNLMQVVLPFPSATGGLHRFDVPENIGNSLWNTSYRWLNNVEEMYNASVEASDPNYQAIAMTLNAWIYSNLTSVFGDVPLTEATKAEESILRPKFNTEKDIYIKLLADLDSANNLYNKTRNLNFGTDILYGNRISSASLVVAAWQKFTNSLKMRLLLHLSKKAEINAYAQLKVMIDNPTKYPVFVTNDDGAIVKLSGITPQASPWGRPIDFTTFRAAGKFFVDTLNDWNDPRRAKFLTFSRTATGGATTTYRGIPSGYSGSENQFGYTPSNVNQALVTAPMICPILPYAEVEFIKSEVELFYNNATAAKAAYEKGVKAAIEQWGAVMPADYLINANTAYNGTLQRILIQKYYALFFVDYQQWFEYRRTGFPVLPVADGMLNNKQVPVRFRYPIAVRTNNPENYIQAVQSVGADDINTKLWWEK